MRLHSKICEIDSDLSPRIRNSFLATIRENLQFVRPDATDEECLESCIKPPSRVYYCERITDSTRRSAKVESKSQVRR